MSLQGLIELNSDELDRLFYRCVDHVAHELIGLFLFNRLENDLVGGQIIEAEAYCENDPAAHCYGDNRPHRWSPPQRWFDSMYLSGGHVYIYPMWCLNVICGPKGFGSGVLIRALWPTCGLDVMRKHRERQRPAARTNDAYLCDGPENLCQALSITKGYDGQNLLDTTLRLFQAAILISEGKMWTENKHSRK